MAYLTALTSPTVIVPSALVWPWPTPLAGGTSTGLYLKNGRPMVAKTQPIGSRKIALATTTITALSVSVANADIAGTSSTDGTTASAPSVQAIATTAGGSGTPNYTWTRTDTGGGTAFSISSASASNPVFSIPSGTTAYSATQYWRVTATAGDESASVTVRVTLTRSVVSGGSTFAVSPTGDQSVSGVRGDTLSVIYTVTGAAGALSTTWVAGGDRMTVTINSGAGTVTVSSSTVSGAAAVTRTGTLRITDGTSSADRNIDFGWDGSSGL